MEEFKKLFTNYVDRQKADLLGKRATLDFLMEQKVPDEVAVRTAKDVHNQLARDIKLLQQIVDYFPKLSAKKESTDNESMNDIFKRFMDGLGMQK